MKNLNKTVVALTLSAGLAFSFAVPAFASHPDTDFIDVSNNNSQKGLPLSFYQTLKAGKQVKGVVVKVSEGAYFVDPAASVNIANAKQAGLIVNAYHFARFTSNAAAINEAKWFDKKLKLVGFNKDRDGYVVIDVETNLSKSPAKLTQYTNAFMSEMRKLGYKRIDLYTGSYFYNGSLRPKSLNVTKPWLAGYPKTPVRNHPTVNFSNGKGSWQWASDYQFIGMTRYGHFDVSEDYAGKYTTKTKATQKFSTKVGKIKSISLLDYLKSHRMDSTDKGIAKLAGKYGITNYTGTDAQNLAILSKLQTGVKPAKVNTSNSKLTTKPAAKPASIKTHTVIKGDSLWRIAVANKTTVSKIKSLNHLKSDLIKPGQKLRIK